MRKKIKIATTHKPGHYKMTPEEVQALLVARKGGHVHQDKRKQIDRKRKYK